MPLATFAYDALGRKITAWTQYDGTSDGLTQDLRFYHDGKVEIADYQSDNSTLARRFINGTQYIDERAVLIEGAAASADTFYSLLQELDTVTGLIEKNGALAEADVYDGSGKVKIWDYSPGRLRPCGTGFQPVESRVGNPCHILRHGPDNLQRRSSGRRGEQVHAGLDVRPRQRRRHGPHRRGPVQHHQERRRRRGAAVFIRCL